MVKLVPVKAQQVIYLCVEAFGMVRFMVDILLSVVDEWFSMRI
ncbi:hypothetical protein EV194_101674 [Natronoflexus pectinivorans]|uniref:Uncharacterized protein n=1 Tax=Natronoflexus pectinivorans TaxID=682526 RepID=A0A4R2GPH4_9BACT|nr:hypothetical protein EV194_101674 [Natronoflexus pectinivorans]